jgi:hypothetical protein
VITSVDNSISQPKLKINSFAVYNRKTVQIFVVLRFVIAKLFIEANRMTERKYFAFSSQARCPKVLIFV